MSDEHDWIDMPHDLFIRGSDELGTVQANLTKFVREQKEANKKIHLPLDEDLLIANADPWLATSYKTSSSFALMYADKISINYRGETRVVKGKVDA